MKTLILSLILILSSTLSAKAEIVRLLDCRIEGAPIPTATLYSYQGGLWLITTDRDGEILRSPVPGEDWDRRLLYLSKKPDLKGVLFWRDKRWHYSFKGEGGWYMAGQALCQE